MGSLWVRARGMSLVRLASLLAASPQRRCRDRQRCQHLRGLRAEVRPAVAARSGGHSYAGWSITTGLIADVNIRMSTAARC